VADMVNLITVPRAPPAPIIMSTESLALSEVEWVETSLIIWE